MAEETPIDKTAIACALLSAAIGLFYMLFSLGYIQVSGGVAPHGSTWAGFCIGLAFFAGGLAVMIQTIERIVVAPSGGLTAGTPRWARVAMHGLALTVTVCLAAIGLWVAFGPGPREFTSNVPFLGQHIGETVGRAVFGTGAVLICLVLVLATLEGVWRWTGRGKSRSRS
jgi:hypothetical protein